VSSSLDRLWVLDRKEQNFPALRQTLQLQSGALTQIWQWVVCGRITVTFPHPSESIQGTLPTIPRFINREMKTATLAETSESLHSCMPFNSKNWFNVFFCVMFRHLPLSLCFFRHKIAYIQNIFPSLHSRRIRYRCIISVTGVIRNSLRPRGNCCWQHRWWYYSY